MKRFVVFGAVLALLTAFALPAVALKAPASISLEISGQGSVVFDHAGHEGFVGNCKSCHHMGVGNGDCSGCHGRTPIAPALADAYSTLCQRCHAADPAAAPAPEPTTQRWRDRFRR